MRGHAETTVGMHPCADPVSMAATALRGSVPGPIERHGFARQALLSGVAVVAAAVLAEFGHGAFTYAVLEGLEGGADAAPGDGIVSIYELLAYIDRRIPEVSRQYKAKPQYPVVDSRGMNFPLVAVRRDDSARAESREN